MKELFWGLLVAAVLLVGLPFYSYKMTEWFKPKYTEIDRRTFEESRAFNEGMVRDLENLQMQYVAADPVQKEALRATILHRFSVYPEDRMPVDLRNFYRDLRNEGMSK